MRIGDYYLDFLGHAGFMIKLKNKVVYIDPYHISDSLPKADIILISHSHYDHCSIKDIQKISKNGTIVLCTVDCQSTITKIKNIEVHIVESQEILDFGNFKIECFPAYTAHVKHSKNEGWLGYLLKFDKNIIYFAGDTDNIPEIKNLSGYGKKGNNFIALLPVAGGVVMDYFTASNVASSLNPTMAIPMSYGSGVYGTLNDAKMFVELCSQKGVRAEILEKV